MHKWRSVECVQLFCNRLIFIGILRPISHCHCVYVTLITEILKWCTVDLRRQRLLYLPNSGAQPPGKNTKLLPVWQSFFGNARSFGKSPVTSHGVIGVYVHFTFIKERSVRHWRLCEKWNVKIYLLIFLPTLFFTGHKLHLHWIATEAPVREIH